MRTHYGIKPYICDICSKEFNDKGNLKTHLRIHTGERPYKCNICCKAFKTEGQLKEHFGSHYKDKPFQCPYCLKYFKRKGVVKNHIIIHYQDPLFIEKKNYYKKIVDSLDNKNLLDFCYKNSSIFSTKDESQNSSPIAPTLKSKEKPIKDSSFSLNSLNETSIKDKQQIEVGKDNKKLCINDNNNEYNSYNNETLFYDKILINYNEENCNKNIDFLENNFEFYKKNENQDQYEFMDENSIYYPKIKEENKNNILLLEEIL